MIKGCGLMRVWKVEKSQCLDSRNPSRGPSATSCGCRSFKPDVSGPDIPDDSQENCLRSNASFDIVPVFPFQAWLSVFQTMREDDLTEIVALENVLHLLPQGSAMSIQWYPLFRFTDPDLESAYTFWYESTTITSRRFFVFFSAFFIIVLVASVASLSAFKLEPVASSAGWKVFSILFYIFVSALPFALVGAFFLTRKAPKRVREKYMWVSEPPPNCQHRTISLLDSSFVSATF